MNRVARMVSRMIIMRFLPILFGLCLFVITLEVVTYAKEILSLSNDGLTMIAKYIIARFPATMATFLPISLLLSLLLTVTELSYRNELTAIWSIGLSPLKLIMTLAPLALLIGAMHFAIVDRAVPAAAPILRSWGIADYGEKKLKIGEKDPIWLRSGTDIMRAAGANAEATRLSDVLIFKRDKLHRCNPRAGCCKMLWCTVLVPRPPPVQHNSSMLAPCGPLKQAPDQAIQRK
jgi:lipopolysaccharide export system permease protein